MTTSPWYGGSLTHPPRSSPLVALSGNTDLAPTYLSTPSATHFHTQLANVCDAHHPDYYPLFKQQADDYFRIPHRSEARGVGGIFFDTLNKNSGVHRRGDEIDDDELVKLMLGGEDGTDGLQSGADAAAPAATVADPTVPVELVDPLTPGAEGLPEGVAGPERNLEDVFSFVRALGDGWGEAYEGCVRIGLSEAAASLAQNGKKARQEKKERKKRWQGVRRGRWVEFGLVNDKGTKVSLRLRAPIRGRASDESDGWLETDSFSTFLLRL